MINLFSQLQLLIIKLRPAILLTLQLAFLIFTHYDSQSKTELTLNLPQVIRSYSQHGKYYTQKNKA